MTDLQVLERDLEEVPDDTTRAPSRTTNRVSFALSIVPLAVLAIGAWQHRWMSDDGFIHLRVVSELLHGHGPVFNAGERVEASTSPLWVFWLAGTKIVLPFLRLEWIAVWWGIIGSVAGLAMAQRGAWLLERRRTRESAHARLVVPFGALIIAVLSPFWDFATSGLETGMVFAWLGACFWALAAAMPNGSRRRSRRGPRHWGTCALLGLGVLIRPDLALFSFVFLVAYIVIDPNRRWRHRVGTLCFAFAVPFAYEVFRAAFYATLVPNTALAKEPGMSAWARGARYLGDFLTPYWLWIPLVLTAIVLVTQVARDVKQRDRNAVVVALAPVVGGLVYALYVVRIGGDFMHARLLLPALYAVLLPVASLAVPRLARVRVGVLVPVVIVTVWAGVCAAGLRVAYDVGGPGLLSNERGAWIFRSGHAHPVTIDDFAGTWAQYGILAKHEADLGEHVFEVFPSHAYPAHLVLPLSTDVAAGGVAAYPAIGELSYGAGPDVYVGDLLGLGDPVGSRVRVLTFFLPGHNKQVDPSWEIARFVDPSVAINDPNLAIEVANAREAIHCGRLGVLLDDVTGKLTVSKAIGNIFDSWSLTKLRFDPDPSQARFELCK